MEKFVINPIYDTSKGIYAISDYDKVIENVNNFIGEIMKMQPIEIIDKATLKIVKDSRTEIRDRKKEITDARLAINKIYFGTFNDQLKEIEKLLKEADDKLKVNVDAYNTKIGNVKPKLFKITLGHFDQKAIQQVKDLALKLGCTIKEEE